MTPAPETRLRHSAAELIGPILVAMPFTFRNSRATLIASFVAGFGLARQVLRFGTRTRRLKTEPERTSQVSSQSSPVEGSVEWAALQHRLRMATHDLRSSLGPIVGYADLIRISDDLDEARSHADRIAAAAAEIEALADRLSDSVLEADQP